ncbi:MAG: chromate transporter [Rhodoferax sp.]
MTVNFLATDWLALFGQCMLLSLLSIGGAITTAPEMHRYLVNERHWLSDGQFTSSLALAQAAPGPNVLFFAMLGWNVGMNAGGGAGAGRSAWACALLGVVLAMVGILLPSTTLTFTATRWAHQNRQRQTVRAFKQGMAPIGIGLVMSTGWVLAKGHGDLSHDWSLWLVTLATTLIVWLTRVHLLWLLAAGALLGCFGWI